MEEIRTEQQSGGIAIGKAVLLKQPDLAAERREITAAEAEKEQAAFRRAAEQVREALRPLARTNAIFAAHLDMAEDATLLQGVEEKIAAGKNAEWALEEETEELSGMLESLEDAYLRERAADVRDVCRRMMAALKGVSETSLRNITEKVILFAEELHPSDTAQMDFRYIRGMVTEKGGATSHVAILARSLEIPALLGVEGILKKVREGEAVILDGKEGRLIFSPDAKTQAAEMLKKPITIRTLDIGGDKNLPYYQFEKEENPFLGWRAIRFCLDMRDVFKTQLKAILRAAAFGDIRIMYPMIVSVEEFRKANAILEECKAELRERKLLFRESISTGIMVETPAAAFIAEELAKEADFFSIGTNDLTQYILAADRGNQKLTKLYSPFHPAVLRAVAKVIAAGHKEGKEVGMCGEFAADARAVPLLLGMGLDEFSMVSNEIAAVRYQVRGLAAKQTAELARRALAAGTEKEVRGLLER